MSTLKTVYIIDDSPDYLFLVQQVFTRFLPQYPARFFSGGDAFYDSLTADLPRPGLIVMDLNMPPGRSGYEVLMLLKQHADWHPIPVVMMSNSASNQEINQCIEAGANSFVSKPTGLDAFRQVFGTICQYWLDVNQMPA